MKPPLAFVTGCLLISTSIAATHTPSDFAFGMPLQLEGEAAIYSLPVPKEIYRHTVRTDLGDMRVFNSNDEWVTYSVSTPVARTNQAPMVAVPMFPLQGDAARALDRIRISIAAEHGAVNVQTTARDATPAQIQAYVIDARQFDRSMTALELRWPDDAPEFSGRISVERSDDLNTWLPVIGNLPIVNLNFGGQHLLQNRLGFPAIKARYLRLHWQDRPAPFAISEILAEPAATRTGPPREQAEFVAQPVTDQPDTYTFTLDLHAPIDRVNLKLPQPNTVADITLSSRERPDLPWHDVATLRAYELQNNGAELRNAAAVIAPNANRYWRLQTQVTGSLGNGAPRLQVSWIPQEVTFVARGQGPFQLAFGSVNAVAATSPLSSLLADPTTPISVGKASAGPLHELGGPRQLEIKTERPWKKWLLWAVLAGAVVILAGVAHRLSHEISK